MKTMEREAGIEPVTSSLGNRSSFVKRLRVGNEWYRIDLLFFHRRLRALVLIEARKIHARRRGTNESLSELRSRTLAL
jgi:hypothetical protein